MESIIEAETKYTFAFLLNFFIKNTQAQLEENSQYIYGIKLHHI